MKLRHARLRGRRSTWSIRHAAISVVGSVALVAIVWWAVEPRTARSDPALVHPKASAHPEAMPDGSEELRTPPGPVAVSSIVVSTPSEPVSDVTVSLAGDVRLDLTCELNAAEDSEPRSWKESLRSDEPTLFDDLERGEFHLSVAVEDELIGVGAVVFDGDPVRVVVDARDLPHVDLVVVDESGVPVEGATARVRPLHTSAFPAVEFADAADGRLWIGPLPPHGEYLIEVDGPAHVATRVGPLHFSPDAIALEHRVVLRPSRRLDVGVHAPDGTPIVGADVEVAWGRTKRRGTTDRLGAASFEDVELLEAVVTVESRQGLSVARRLTEVGDRDLHLDIVMPPAAYLTGMVRAEHPQDRVRLEAVPLDGDEHRVACFVPFSVTPEGMFEMGPMAEGVYELVDLFDPASRWTVRTGEEFDITLHEWTTHRVDVHLRDVWGERLVVPVVTVVDVGGVLNYPSEPRLPDDNGTVRVVWRAVGERAAISVGAEGFRHGTIDVSGESSIGLMLTPDVERRFSLVAPQAEDDGAVARITERWGASGERFGPGPYGETRRRSLDDRVVWERSVDVQPPWEFGLGKLDREGLSLIVSVPGFFVWRSEDADLFGRQIVLTPLRLDG